MTYVVFGRTLNLTLSIYLSIYPCVDSGQQFSGGFLKTIEDHWR